MRVRVVAWVVVLVLAGCARPEAPPEDASPPATTPSPTPEATPSPAAEPSPSPAPSASPTPPTPSATPTPTPTATPTPADGAGGATNGSDASSPTVLRFARTFDLTLNSAPLVGAPSGAPENDCVRLYASDTTRVLGGNATLTWSGVGAGDLALEMRVEPRWEAPARASGSSPLVLPIGEVTLQPVAQPPSQYAMQGTNTIASGWFKAKTASGSSPAVQQALRLEVVLDHVGGGIDTDIGGCHKPGVTD